MQAKKHVNPSLHVIVPDQLFGQEYLSHIQIQGSFHAFKFPSSSLLQYELTSASNSWSQQIKQNKRVLQTGMDVLLVWWGWVDGARWGGDCLL